MKLKKMIAGLVVVLATVAAVPAFAVNLGQFTDSGVQDFTLTSSGATSTFTATSINVIFTYDVANTYTSTFTPINAKLTMYSEVNGAPGTVGSTVVQPMKLVYITVTADTPHGGLNNLLTVGSTPGSPDTGTFTGALGSEGATDSGGEPTDTVGFSSDFLSLVGLTNEAYSISLTNLSKALALGGNGYLKAFKASGTGTFSADLQAVPEPGTTAAFLFGGLGVLGLIVRGRKTRAGSFAS